ncbi:tyrosine-type recombinase/integrase [Marinobacter sp.]|jgi:site-specific recombinase XerD|nr:tyrosine-type recombinase/integrase [Marinobacter sp.]|tara:strand:- start:9995 stop:10534 length:540 start_codon:yes stop_codon:yes gene_type:complete
MKTVDAMLVLLKPEVLGLLSAEKHAMYRVILELIWTTGARISEMLALTSAFFLDDGYDFGVILRTLKQGAGRPSKRSLQRWPKRQIPIVDPLLEDRVLTYLWSGHFRQHERLSPITRQTVDRPIHRLVAHVGGAPFAISSHTFRHSFAINLLLYGRPLKYVSQLLGRRSIERRRSTPTY